MKLTGRQKFVLLLVVACFGSISVPVALIWNGRPLVTPCFPPPSLLQQQQQQQISSCIPNILHFVKVDNGTREFSFIHWLVWYSAVRNLKPESISFHVDVVPSNQSHWWNLIINNSSSTSKTTTTTPTTTPKLNIDVLDKESRKGLPGNIKKYQHLSDFIRLKILSTQGGIYMDLDSLSLKSFHPRLLCSGFEALFGIQHEKRREIAVGVIAAKPGSFSEQLLNLSIDAFDGRWTTHSVKLLSKTVAGDPRVLLLHQDALYPFYYHIKGLSGVESVTLSKGNISKTSEKSLFSLLNNDIGIANANAFSWCHTYALHLFASHEKMKPLIEKIQNPCSSLSLLSEHPYKELSPAESAIVALVCSAINDGTLPKYEVNNCLENFGNLCSKPYDSFFPCFESRH